MLCFLTKIDVHIWTLLLHTDRCSHKLSQIAVALSLRICDSQTNFNESFDKLPCFYFTHKKHDQFHLQVCVNRTCVALSTNEQRR